MRHDPLAGLILIDQDMIRSLMWRMRKYPESREAINKRFDEVLRQRSGEEGIRFRKGGGDGLQTAVGEDGPTIWGNLGEEGGFFFRGYEGWDVVEGWWEGGDAEGEAGV
jgi:hypothetical protein